jgi:GTP-binding protein Era
MTEKTIPQLSHLCPMEHKSGFVNIIGNPNVGKSTLMNALVGERLSIITPKAQTTRHRIFGILNEPEYQIVFSDTPGVIQPAYKMQEHMMKFVSDSFEDADVFLYLVEPGDRALKDEGFFQKLLNTKVPVLLIINKIDTTNQEKLEEEVAYWTEHLPNAEIIPISALEQANTTYLLDRLITLIPPSPPYFDKDALTDKTERFFVSEIVREQILLNYKKEVPYSVEVDVEEFKEADDIIRIRTVIYVARDTQKGIIIGHKGSKLKQVGIGARKQLESFFAKQVHLETFVKVKKNWRDSDLHLKRFGYKN